MIWLIAACLLWGPSFGLIPILRSEYQMDAYTLSVLRMLFSLLIFAPLMSVHPTSRSQKIKLALLGGLQFGLMYLLLFVSYNFMSGYEVALVTILTPIYVSLLDHFFRKNLITFKPMFCVLLAVLGAGLIRYSRPPEMDNHFWIGFGIMQLCNLCFALGQVLYRRIMSANRKLQDMYAFGWMYLGALGVTLLGWLLMGDPVTALTLIKDLPLPAWGIVLWLGLIPSGLAFFFFNHGALKVDADSLAIVNNLKIPIALIIVMLIFKQWELVHSWQLFVAGTTLMLAALWLNQHHGRKKARHPPS